MASSRLHTLVRDALPTILIGAFAGVAGVVGSYATAGFTPTFVVSPVATSFQALLPNVVIRFAITILGDLGEQLHLLTAVLLVVAGFGTLTALSLALGRRLNNRALPVILTTVAIWGVTVTLTGRPLLSLGAGLPAGATVLVATLAPALPIGTAVDADRRSVLTTGVAVLGFSALGYLLGERRTGGGMPQQLSRAEQLQQLLDDADSKSLGVAGMEPLVSRNFYTVDYSAVNPAVDAADWTFTVTGEVEQDVTYTLDEIRAMQATDRFETLRCVGEHLNGQKMDTALWTGVPITDLVAKASPNSDCNCVMFRAADGYYEEFPLAALADGLLAYGMNGRELPRAHGYPARALVPGHWGEINVKWITEIEILEREAQGYWEKRGWHGTGPVRTVAKLHAVNDLDDGRTELGGHAYAGTRGIQSVEVSTDGGSTWETATLSAKLSGIDVWRQWRYVYDPPEGNHEVVVRATDGTGTLQPRTTASPYPNGPSGWVSKTIR
ncbi:MAG: molybdopterin-dependent oxidoreductase [Halorientalis sp.]